MSSNETETEHTIMIIVIGFSRTWIGKAQTAKISVCPSLNLMCHFTENPHTRTTINAVKSEKQRAREPRPERETERELTWPIRDRILTIFFNGYELVLCVCVCKRTLRTTAIAISIKSSLKERNSIYTYCMQTSLLLNLRSFNRRRCRCRSHSRTLVYLYLHLSMLHFFVHVHGGKPCGFIHSRRKTTKHHINKRETEKNLVIIKGMIWNTKVCIWNLSKYEIMKKKSISVVPERGHESK